MRLRQVGLSPGDGQLTIRVKVLLIAGVAVLATAGLMYVTSRFTFIRGINEIEENHARDTVAQMLNAYSYLVSRLEADTANWATSDDAYAFITDGNEDYAASYLIDETFVALELNLMVFVDPDGVVALGKAFDLAGAGGAGVEMPLPESLADHLAGDSLLIGRAGEHTFGSGIVLLDDGPLLVASQPILTSRGEGPARGVVIFGRYLNSATVASLSRVVGFPMTVHALDHDHPEFADALASLSAAQPAFVEHLDSRHTGGYTLLEDIYGEPAVMLTVEIPRDAFQLGQVAVVYYILSVFGAGILVAGSALFILQRQVLSRFGRLLRGIDAIAQSGDTSNRISVGGGDELTSIAGTINGMLAALEATATEIRESEDRYRDLFDNAIDLIQSVTSDGRFLLVNEAWRQALGYGQAEIAALSLSDVIHRDHLADWDEMTRKLAAGEPIDSLETVLVTAGGAEIIVEGNVSCRFEDGEAVSTRAIFRDITLRKRTEQELQVLYQRERVIRQELEEETRKRTEFTRALVHELRTPITPVLAATELLLERVVDEQSRRLVESIDRSASNLNRRIDELVDLIRGETDMLPLALERVDVVSLLRDAGTDMAPVAASEGHSLTVELPSAGPDVWADSDRLRQVVQNLMNNAFKFTPAGGEITLLARVEGATLVVEVRDSGPGIAEEDLERLFDPYYRRVEDRERLSGLGLGLALSKRLVELHGGEIWVKSQLGKGTTLGFSLPVMPDEDSERPDERIEDEGESKVTP